MSDRETGYFPMFVNIKDKRVLVAGGGKIAARRVNNLLMFGCQVVIIAPELRGSLKDMWESWQGETDRGIEKKQVQWIPRNYKPGDCQGAFLAVAATDNRQVNQAIGEECRNLGIPVSVADCKGESTFYFPGIVKKEHLVIGITSSGYSHKQAANTAQKIRGILDEE